jgi:hypothetical protein
MCIALHACRNIRRLQCCQKDLVISTLLFWMILLKQFEVRAQNNACLVLQAHSNNQGPAVSPADSEGLNLCTTNVPAFSCLQDKLLLS